MTLANQNPQASMQCAQPTPRYVSLVCISSVVLLASTLLIQISQRSTGGTEPRKALSAVTAKSGSRAPSATEQPRVVPIERWVRVPVDSREDAGAPYPVPPTLVGKSDIQTDESRRLDEAYDSEPLNAAQTRAIGARIESALATVLERRTEGDAALEAAECRETVCRLQFTATDLAVLVSLAHESGVAGARFQQVSEELDQGSGLTRYTFYMGMQ